MTGRDDEQFRSTLPVGRRASAARIARAWVPALVWMAVIFVLSAQPGLRVSDDPNVDLPIRHMAHVVVYAVLAALLLRAVAWAGVSQWTWRYVLLSIALATLYGVTDEVHQTYVPLRNGHLVDVGWDLLGAVAGVAILRLAPWRRLRRPSVVARPD